MRILQVIPAFPPSVGYGGGPVVAYEISRHLVLRGHDVTVVTTDANNEKERIKKEFDRLDGIKVHYFKNISNYLAYHHKIFISPRLISWARAEVKKFDIIHLHDTRTIQNIIVTHYARKYNVPYVIQPHGTLSYSMREMAKKIFDIFFGKKMLKDARKLVVLNEKEAKRCIKIGVDKEKIRIIPNGIDLSAYRRKLTKKGEFKKEYKISADHQVVLYLGRIHKSKGIELLIRAFAKLSNRLDNVRLAIVGPDDGYSTTLTAMVDYLGIRDKVTFVSFVSEEHKFAVYSDADIFVTPTFYGFPLTFLEAMACGVPIITTDKGDFIEGIDNEVGFVVKYNEEDLENAMFRILTDVELREKLKGNAQKKIKEYDWDRIVDRIEKVYKEVMEKSA